MSSNIDLIHFGNSQVQWTLGNSFATEADPASLQETIEEVIKATDASWILFWDHNVGQPDEELIKYLAQQPVDAYHAGLRFNLQEYPDVMNYVHPTWMYNSNAVVEVTHTNFRLSFRACLVRVDTIRKTGLHFDVYESLDMAGIAFGYQLLKQGGIVRYHASLLKKTQSAKPDIAINDEWIFACQFFPRKWQIWVLFNKKGWLKNYKAWRKTKHIKYINPKPSIHSSEKENTKVEPASVSILAPTLDRYPYIKEELRELNEQTILPLEILITDQTDKEHRQHIDFNKYLKLTVKYFPQDEKGQCIAWNKLIEEAKGEYIFFFGDDAYDIKPDLIEKMLQTMYRFNADMVASNVREKGIKYGPVNHHYFVSDSFPITLIKRSVVTEAGGMDMFFNRNVKADHDLAMRCHMNGALMIFDPSALIGHHRAPSGGLRAHKARVVTNYMTKNSITKILNPTTSEIFIYKKHYTGKQFKNHVRIKYMNQLLINGNAIRKLLRIFFFLYKIPAMKKAYKENKYIAESELQKRGISF